MAIGNENEGCTCIGPGSHSAACPVHGQHQAGLQQPQTTEDWLRLKMGQIKEMFSFECTCGFRTKGLSFDQLIDHLVYSHGYNRAEVKKALRGAIEEEKKKER